jgi:hypothetical protein
LYGKFLPNNGAKVELVYEPPQEGSETTFHLLDDPLSVTFFISFILSLTAAVFLLLAQSGGVSAIVRTSKSWLDIFSSSQRKRVLPLFAL